MLCSRPAKPIAGALLGFAICFSSTAAAAATAAPRSISPIVALSAFAAPGSGSALCAAAGASTISAAAQVQPAPGTGCVLPVVDQPLPVAPQAEPVAYYPPVASQGLGLLPVLAGLVLIAGLAAFLLSSDDEGEINFPGSNPPLSPD